MEDKMQRTFEFAHNDLQLADKYLCEMLTEIKNLRLQLKQAEDSLAAECTRKNNEGFEAKATFAEKLAEQLRQNRDLRSQIEVRNREINRLRECSGEQLKDNVDLRRQLAERGPCPECQRRQALGAMCEILRERTEALEKDNKRLHARITELEAARS